MKRISIYINDEQEKKLLEEVDAMAKENYMTRSRFTKMSWLVYIKYLRKQVEL